MDERTSKLPRLPRGAQRWLREIFIQDWNLKLLALAITLGLWYAVTGQRTPATVRFRGVQLRFQLPSDMEISNDPRDEVEVTLTGNKQDLDRINPRDLVAFVDVSNYKPGERVVQLWRDRVKMELPNGVRIVDIEPNVVPLRLEPRIERLVDVEAQLEGKLPEGYELRGIYPTPDKVRVRGPASNVNALQKAPTETISLDGRKESFTVQEAAIDISDPKVDVIDTIVHVYVEIGEQRIERIFTGVTVRESTGGRARPETASVTVYGERSAVEQLRVENMQLLLEVAPDGAITPRLVLPPSIAGRVELRSTKPTGFSIIK